MNDFLIPSNNLLPDGQKDGPQVNPIMGDGPATSKGRQFQIFFDPNDRHYKIRDLGRGFGAFAKLQGSIVLRDNFLVNIGESFIVAHLISNQDYGEEDQLQPYNEMPFKLKLKIFPPYSLENPDVV